MARDLTSFRPPWHAAWAPATLRTGLDELTDLGGERAQHPPEAGVADRSEHAVGEGVGELGDADGRIAEAAVGRMLRRRRVDVGADGPAGVHDVRPELARLGVLTAQLRRPDNAVRRGRCRDG